MKRLEKKNRGRLRRGRWINQMILQIYRDDNDIEGIKRFLIAGRRNSRNSLKELVQKYKAEQIKWKKTT